jgi:predicted nucleic acid-binding Zn ribbon protein
MERLSGDALIAAYIDKLAAAYVAGATLEELSEQYRLSPGTIRSRLKRAGIALRRGGSQPGKRARAASKAKQNVPPRIHVCKICGAAILKKRDRLYCSRECYLLGSADEVRSGATKECNWCHERKPLSDFYCRSWPLVGWYAHCKTCHNARVCARYHRLKRRAA